MSTAWFAFRKLQRWFQRARDGNVAITFAIALIPLLAFIGAAVDYSRANAVKASMQSALDATALMLSKDAANLSDVDANGTGSNLDSRALAVFTALFKGKDVRNIKVNATYSTGNGSSVEVTGSAEVPTTFLAIIGFKSIKVGGASTSKWGFTRLRVALVLDNTGSMGQSGKLNALKTATKNLLSQLQAAASSPGDVYVSIIPFAKDVNVNAANYTASWDDWLDWGPLIDTPSDDIGPGSACPYSSRRDGYTCVTRPGGTTTTYTIPTSGTYKGAICPSNSIGCFDSVANTTTTTTVVSSGWYASCYGYFNCSCTGFGSSRVCSQTTTTTIYSHTWFVDKSKWNGCITDRGSNSGPVSDYDRLTTAPTPSIAATLFPVEQYDACPQTMTGLSDDWTAMNSLVDNMTANGSTNQPIGLVWGWQSLVGGGPFSVPAMDANYEYSQVIILLSDGLNTQDRWYGNGSSTSTRVDDRMYDDSGHGTCANIKAADITIYTIQVNTSGDPTSTLLQNCASSSAKFFLLTSANQIVTTFESIGTSLTKLRVAK